MLVLTVYLIFQFVKKSPKLLISPGLVIIGASWQSAGAKKEKATFPVRDQKNVLSPRQNREWTPWFRDLKKFHEFKTTQKKKEGNFSISRPKKLSWFWDPKQIVWVQDKQNGNVSSSRPKKRKEKKEKCSFQDWKYREILEAKRVFIQYSG